MLFELLEFFADPEEELLFLLLLLKANGKRVERALH